MTDDELLDAVAKAQYGPTCTADEWLTFGQCQSVSETRRILTAAFDRERAALVAENERLRRDAAVLARLREPIDNEQITEVERAMIRAMIRESGNVEGGTLSDILLAALTAADAATGARGMKAEAT